MNRSTQTDLLGSDDFDGKQWLVAVLHGQNPDWNRSRVRFPPLGKWNPTRPISFPSSRSLLDLDEFLRSSTKYGGDLKFSDQIWWSSPLPPHCFNDSDRNPTATHWDSSCQNCHSLRVYGGFHSPPPELIGSSSSWAQTRPRPTCGLP